MRTPRRLSTLLATLTLTVGFAVTLPVPAHAFVLIPDCARSSGLETPGLDCAMETFKNVAFLIYGVSGSVALLFFVYGGFLILLSGFSEQVAKGKGYIKNATIGLLIIMVSSYATDYFLKKLTDGSAKTLGAACAGGGVWGYQEGPKDSSGKVAQVIACIKECEKIGPGYKCTGADAAAFSSCNDLITSCGKGERCCASGTEGPLKK